MKNTPIFNGFVTIKKTGEKGRWIGTYPAHDGVTLLIKTPAGDRHVDMPVGGNAADYLDDLPCKVRTVLSFPGDPDIELRSEG